MHRQIRLTSMLCGLFCLAMQGISQTPFWLQTNGPEGGRIAAIAVSQQGTIVAAARLSGIYRSADNGETWSAASSGLPPAASWIDSIVADSHGHFFVSSWPYVWRSADGGANWSPAGAGGVAPSPLAMAPSGAIFGGGWGVVWRSSDEGVSWEHFTILGLDGSVTALALGPSGPVYAGTGNNGVYVSSNNGETWTQTGLPGKWVTALSVNNNEDVFVALSGQQPPPDGGLYPGGLYRSMDRGATWQYIAPPANNWWYQVAGLAFNAQGHVFAYGSQAGIWRSTDQGATWVSLAFPERWTAADALAIKPDGTVFAGAWGAGVYRSSDNGDHWVQASRGLKAAMVYSLATVGNTVFAASEPEGAFRSTNSGQTWSLVDPLFVPSCCLALAANSAGHIYLGGNVFRHSMDGGQTWTDAPPIQLFGGCPPGALTIDRQNRIYAGRVGPACGLAGLVRSADNGATWTHLGLQNRVVSHMAIGPGGLILAFEAGVGIWRSPDDGKTWTQVLQVPFWQTFTALAVTPKANTFATLCAEDGNCRLHRSTNGGDSWSIVYHGEVGAMAVNAAGRIFAAVNASPVISSSDEGATWNEHPSPPMRTLALAFDSSGYLYGGAWDAAVWRSVEPTYTGKKLASLGPATLCVGLKNSDDQGTQFDVRTELYRNGNTLLSAGQSLCVTGVTRNPDLAKHVSVAFGSIADSALTPGDVLSLKVLTRIGTNPDGSKCSGPGGSHNSAVGLRLYYDAASQPSRFGAEIPPDPLRDFFLHSTATDFFDPTAPTAATAKFKDSAGCFLSLMTIFTQF